MAEDTRKVLMIILSVSFVAIAFVGIALLFAWPGTKAERTPAGLQARNVPVSAADAWVNPGLVSPGTSSPDTRTTESTSQESQTAAAGTTISGDSIVIIYGNKPEAGTLSPPSGTASTAGTPVAPTTPTTTNQVTKPYAPAPATPAASTARSSPASSGTASTTSRTTTTTVAAAIPTIRNEYWIQAASLSSRTRAEDLQTRLKASALSAIITIHEIDGTPWYRVRIGPYQNKTEADGWVSRIRSMPGCEEAYVSMVTVRP